MITNDYQAKLLAYQLSRNYFSDDFKKVVKILQDAKVDLNPHQVDAALFAFKSPFSKGAILADEVGLGKTIEAGLVISQNWAENKKKILIIVPSSLRKQWSTELYEKFYLPSTILESKSFNNFIKQGNLNPFIQNEIIITSYNFAVNKIPYIKSISWDLIIIDEAHRLRNAYKANNRIARTLKENLSDYKKVLLTATPLQNSLLELYSLVGFIDENIFGDLTSYKQNFVHGEMQQKDFKDLKERISPVIQRTLRRQVLEYVKYTNRIPITQEFAPNPDEQELYNKINNYLSRDKLLALSNSQRQLITLIMRKLLASSSFAIAGTLETLIARLEKKLNKITSVKFNTVANLISDENEDYDDIYLSDEEDDEKDEIEEELESASPEELKEEIAELKKYLKLAQSIKYNAKGESLELALTKGFEKLKKLGANQKAVIFTESTRTQNYVKDLLTEKGYKIVLFNGSNNDDKSKEIYNNWLAKNKYTNKITGSKTADKRQALVDYFRDEAEIMIATEAAAEGINLQFCSLVVNYDLPWNPQRIEQRIGRCHRYGQKYDVVVVNFLNTKNQADLRVHELLTEKFHLFEGVFGSSDTVLGSLESGVDFEKRINDIYGLCRTKEEIDSAFDKLKAELDEQISSKMESTRKKLLENFDEQVHEKLRMNLKKSKEYVNILEQALWDLTEYELADEYVFNDYDYTFRNKKNQRIEYTLKDKNSDTKIFYRIESDLSKSVIEKAKVATTPNAELIFDLSNHTSHIAILNELKNKSGYISIYNLEIDGIEKENHIVMVGIDNNGKALSEEQIERMFRLNSKISENSFDIPKELEALLADERQNLLTQIELRNSKFFDEEMEKLEKWSKDLKDSLELKLRQMDIDIKTLKTESKKIIRLDEKLNIQKRIKNLEVKRNKLRLNLYEEQDKIDNEKDALIDNIASKLKSNQKYDKIFTIKWGIV